MSAKIISSLTEENRDLQKQIGCMNGIFQLFDRHYFVTGRRTSSSHKHKRLLQGANHNKESQAAIEKATENYLDVTEKDKTRVSTESPRTSSLSFACSSTLSLLDRNKTVQAGPPPSKQCNSFESPTQISLQQRSPSLLSYQQSIDLRDIIKDSMQREHRALSVKTVGKEESKGHIMKHIDSPRPSQQLKSGQPRAACFDGSSHALAKLQEAPRSCRAEKDAPMRLVEKDPPRFSYDGRETRDAFKSKTKLKELPRLSLDSRESSLRSSLSEPRLNFHLRDLQRDNGNTTQMINTNQDPGSNKRSSNVFVKLMGLEAFPDSNSRNEGEVTKLHSYPDEDFVTRSSNKASDRRKQTPVFSPEVVQKDPASPWSRNASLAMKTTSNSRFPIEPAPWRQLDAGQDAPRTTQKNSGGCPSATHAASTVYGEIEKRISELEFRKSGKDLRALKRILEAMHKSRKRLEIQKGEEVELESETSRSSSDYSRCNQVTRASDDQRSQSYFLAKSKGSHSPKRLNSAIIISKGAGPTNSSSSGLQRLRTQNTVNRREDSIDKLATKDLTLRNSALKDPSRCKSYTDNKSIEKTLKTLQTSRAPQLGKAEKYAAFGRSSASVSPRSQGKQQEIDKKSCTTNPSPDSSKARRKSSKPTMKSDSSTGILRPQSTNLQRGNQKVSSNTDSRNFSHQGDMASVKSESNNSLASQIETEVTSTESSIEINAKPQIKPKERDFAARLSEDMTFAELAIPASEQPSPISVLDSTFYREDSPSPMKKISTVFRDYGTPEPDEAEWPLDNPDNLSESIGLKLGDEFNQKKLENIEHLVHKFRLLNTTHNEASMDKIATLCRSHNPDHKYITKVLQASGLIKDIGTFSMAIQLHSSGHLINPNLFHVLEQAEQYAELANQEHSRKIAPLKSDKKIHRKILFDTINEILVRKFTSEGPFMAKKRTKTWQGLLNELYSEIDRLQATPDYSLEDDDELATILNVDMMQQPDEWEDSRGEIPAVVLHIERLIFKDLITEVITDEGVGLHDWQRRQGRKLFTKY